MIEKFKRDLFGARNGRKDDLSVHPFRIDRRASRPLKRG
jgi:hypothetical protein